MTISIMFLLFAILLLFSGFFSGSEIALVSADRIRLQEEANRGRRGSIMALNMLDRPTRMLSTCLVGTNLCAISIATLGTKMVLANMEL